MQSLRGSVSDTVVLLTLSTCRYEVESHARLALPSAVVARHLKQAARFTGDVLVNVTISVANTGDVRSKHSVLAYVT